MRNASDKKADDLYRWLLFGALAVSFPLVFNLGLHKFVLGDLNIFDYLSDILLLAISISTSAFCELVLAEPNIKRCIFITIKIIDILLIAILFGLYSALYATMYVPSESINRNAVLMFSWICIAVEFILGTIFSIFEE